MSALDLALYRGLMRVRPAFVASAIKRVLRLRRQLVTTPLGSFEVDPVSHLGLSLLTHYSYEPEMESFIEREIGPGMTFIDVGANEGYFSIAAARRVGLQGRVISVEPQARLHG